MAITLAKLERRARYTAGTAALIGLLGIGALKLGWIATAPVYKPDAWYRVAGTASLVVTTEYANEAACRRDEPAAVCRSGRALTDAAGTDAAGRS